VITVLKKRNYGARKELRSGRASLRGWHKRRLRVHHDQRVPLWRPPWPISAPIVTPQGALLLLPFLAIAARHDIIYIHNIHTQNASFCYWRISLLLRVRDAKIRAEKKEKTLISENKNDAVFSLLCHYHFLL